MTSVTKSKSKEQLQIEKLEKQAAQEKLRMIKPGECNKYIKVLIDPDLLNGPFGSQILPQLGVNFQHELHSQPYPNTITWRRKNPLSLIADDKDCQLIMSDKYTEESHVLFVMSGEELVLAINRKELTVLVQRVKKVFPGKTATLVIYGLRAYCQKHRGCIGRRESEFALCELQVLENCCHRMLESTEELGELVAQFSKSVAEKPFKKQKSEKYEQDLFYLGNDSKDCIHVTNGLGLGRLWFRQLIKMPQLTFEVAHSITIAYPMPRLLIEAFEAAGDDAPFLLADIPVQRHVGPLASNKRVGKEVSKKVYNLLMSESPEDIL